MLLNVIKILTVLSFCFIQINGEHLGGPLILLLFISLFNGSALSIISTLLLIFALALILLTIVKKIALEKIIILISIITLLAPLLLETIDIIEHNRWQSTKPFQYSVALFIAFASCLSILIFRNKQKT